MKKQSKLFVISLIGLLMIGCSTTKPDFLDDFFYYRYQNKMNEIIIIKLYPNNDVISDNNTDSIILSPNQCSNEFTLKKSRDGVLMMTIDSIDIVSYKSNVLLKRYRRHHRYSQPSLTKTPFDINYYVSEGSIVGCSAGNGISQVYLIQEEDFY